MNLIADTSWRGLAVASAAAHDIPVTLALGWGCTGFLLAASYHHDLARAKRLYRQASDEPRL